MLISDYWLMNNKQIMEKYFTESYITNEIRLLNNNNVTIIKKITENPAKS